MNGMKTCVTQLSLRRGLHEQFVNPLKRTVVMDRTKIARFFLFQAYH
ncbi:hypothetical protein [Sutcliffiella horikoshii]|nr:hypothetical protein [Sutcliffiella horikoshii]